MSAHAAPAAPAPTMAIDCGRPGFKPGRRAAGSGRPYTKHLDRRECRRALRLPRPQVETGVVPRASDRVADDDPFLERSVVVRARRADGERLVTAADDQRLFSVDLRHFALHRNSDRDTASLRSVP